MAQGGGPKAPASPGTVVSADDPREEMLPLPDASQARGCPEQSISSGNHTGSQGNIARHTTLEEKAGPEKASRTLPCPVPHFIPSGEEHPKPSFSSGGDHGPCWSGAPMATPTAAWGFRRPPWPGETGRRVQPEGQRGYQLSPSAATAIRETLQGSTSSPRHPRSSRTVSLGPLSAKNKKAPRATQFPAALSLLCVLLIKNIKVAILQHEWK